MGLAVDEYADEYEGGQLGLAVPGEQRSLLARSMPSIPTRCAAHDKLGCCEAADEPEESLTHAERLDRARNG